MSSYLVVHGQPELLATCPISAPKVTGFNELSRFRLAMDNLELWPRLSYERRPFRDSLQQEMFGGIHRMIPESLVRILALA